MTNVLPLTTPFLLVSILFLLIAVLGQSKLGLIEINPGWFGRLLALLIGIFCLATAILLVLFPAETLLELIQSNLAKQLQQNLNRFY